MHDALALEVPRQGLTAAGLLFRTRLVRARLGVVILVIGIIG